MSEDIVKKTKQLIITFVNLGVFVVLIGLLFAGGIANLPENTDVERYGKVILMAISGVIVLFGIVAWDVLAGINKIEIALEDIKQKLSK